MKKLLFALSLILTIQLGAQTKEAADALKEIAKAQSDTQNPKKAESPATWIRMSDAYVGVFDAPIKSVWAGASQTELKVVLKDQRIISSDSRTLNGETFTVDTYYDKDLYYFPDGKLAAWVVTKPYMKGDLLKEGTDALVKAEGFAKGSKDKDLLERFLALKTRYVNEAVNFYTLGDFKKASENFEAAVNISQNKIVNAPDTIMIYNVGFTANLVGETDKAITYFKMALARNYDAKGELYSRLAEAYKANKEIDKAKETLGTGFQKYPTNQSILVSLINLYLETNDDTNKVLELIKQAQANEPQNASLYYAEGNVWKKLNNMEKAIECYKKSVETDPNYVFGSFAIGSTYYDKAVEIQSKASEEVDDKKYEAMVKQLEIYLETAIAPFEKCYEVSTDKEIKAVVAEYLKNIYFRFREKGDTFKAGFEKFNAIYESSKQQ
ncbi:MAG: tetratricopeptide repeat protein [Bacteroidales bacterium]|nr:tetratricopeptide repeat protein [Bacteroidales bacterium]